MAGRVLAHSSSRSIGTTVASLCRRPFHVQILISDPLFNTHLLPRVAFLQPRRLPFIHPLCDVRGLPSGQLWIHSYPYLSAEERQTEEPKNFEANANATTNGEVKLKRPKLKGKRAVVRWLKFFRWKKKKNYQRMTAEEKILYKLRKARKKEERFVVGLEKIEPSELSETTHDPEILTPEEHYAFLKKGLKSKNYVPIGRRGIYKGVILNMHLHWKKHETLQVIVKTFSAEEVKDVAVELARLTGGIVLDIHEENTIIMYRGKNYSQPPTEIMSPRETLSRKKALDKSKYRDGLRAVRKYIPRLEQDLELLLANNQSVAEQKADTAEDTKITDRNRMLEMPNRVKEIIERTEEFMGNDFNAELDVGSDSEDLSDIFETDSEPEPDNRAEQNLYLDAFEKLPDQKRDDDYDESEEDFEEHLRQISMEARYSKSGKHEEDINKVDHSPSFDEVDRMVLRAASLLKKKRR